MFTYLTDDMGCLEYKCQPVATSHFCYKIIQQLKKKQWLSLEEEKAGRGGEGRGNREGGKKGEGLTHER